MAHGAWKATFGMEGPVLEEAHPLSPDVMLRWGMLVAWPRQVERSTKVGG